MFLVSLNQIISKGKFISFIQKLYLPDSLNKNSIPVPFSKLALPESPSIFSWSEIASSTEKQFFSKQTEYSPEFKLIKLPSIIAATTNRGITTIRKAIKERTILLEIVFQKGISKCISKYISKIRNKLNERI